MMGDMEPLLEVPFFNYPGYSLRNTPWHFTDELVEQPIDHSAPKEYQNWVI
jgi:hypothetical protein